MEKAGEAGSGSTRQRIMSDTVVSCDVLVAAVSTFRASQLDMDPRRWMFGSEGWTKAIATCWDDSLDQAL